MVRARMHKSFENKKNSLVRPGSPQEANWSQISIHTAPEVTRWELLLFNKQLTVHWVLGLCLGNVGLLSEEKIRHAYFEVAN